MVHFAFIQGEAQLFGGEVEHFGGEASPALPPLLISFQFQIIIKVLTCCI